MTKKFGYEDRHEWLERMATQGPDPKVMRKRLTRTASTTVLQGVYEELVALRRMTARDLLSREREEV
jgi:hypothetical protein